MQLVFSLLPDWIESVRVDVGFPVVRTDGQSYGHVITKFFLGRLPHFLSYRAPPTRALRARVELRYYFFFAFVREPGNGSSRTKG